MEQSSGYLPCPGNGEEITGLKATTAVSEFKKGRGNEL